jgi:hypothetical protein
MKVPGSDNTSNSNADGDSRVPWISKRVLGGKRGTVRIMRASSAMSVAHPRDRLAICACSPAQPAQQPCSQMMPVCWPGGVGGERRSEQRTATRKWREAERCWVTPVSALQSRKERSGHEPISRRAAYERTGTASLSSSPRCRYLVARATRRVEMGQKAGDRGKIGLSEDHLH